MTLTTASPCGCGSSLRVDRCCSLDWSTPWPPGDSFPSLEGDTDKAEARLIEKLERSPLNVAALMALKDLRASEGRLSAVEAILHRILRIDPNHLIATQALALASFNQAKLFEAERHARNAVRLAPLDAQSHNLMGMIMTEAHRPHVGEYHYRRAFELLPHQSAILLANLAWNLKNQGRMTESRALYEQSAALDPTIFQTMFGWAKMEESDRNIVRANELLDLAELLSPGDPRVLLQRAVFQGRLAQFDDAVRTLAAIESRHPGGLGPSAESEKGLLLDKMGRHDEAFASFSSGKRKLRELTGVSYRAEEAAALASRLKAFFVERRVNNLPRATVRSDVAQPIFVVGFPRSGTTMVEQTLSAHPQIAAGDELPLINELTTLIPRMLDSTLGYPSALAELWFGDKREGIDNLRDFYLQRARQLGVMRDGADWFTDKMPLNETHLGVIALMFPTAPIIHLLRHPLDVVLSVFSNHLTHGFYCAYDLASIAQHYVLTMDLVEHYLRESKPRYLAVRYEDVIDRQEEKVREMLAFIGAPFDSRCLDFHANRRYARTASYAQVTEKLYGKSRYRYRAYLKYLAPVVPTLEPVIDRLGYRID